MTTDCLRFIFVDSLFRDRDRFTFKTHT